MIKHTPKIRRLTYIIGFSSIIIGVLGILTILGILQYRKSQLPPEKPCKQFVQEDIVPISFKVHVVEVQEETNCGFMIRTDHPVAGRTLFCFCLSEDMKRRYFISVGDIFIKEAETNMISFRKPEGYASVTFEYPCCP